MPNRNLQSAPRNILQCCEDPTRDETYRAALAYARAGLSLIPIAAGGEKNPAFWQLPTFPVPGKPPRRSWKVFQQRRPTLNEITAWYGPSEDGREIGIGVIGGQVSGGLEILDLDSFDLVKPFAQALETRAPGLLRRLVKVRTPRPGLHVYYRCDVTGGNQKLARIVDPDSPPENPKPKTIIEVKGEKGYCLAPPSPAACHKSLRCYQFIGGRDLTAIPTISAQEREILHAVARSFDRWVDVRPQRTVRPTKRGVPGARRPGDDFNARADWREILEPHGWQLIGEGEGDMLYWCRPGKGCGCSATTNFKDRDLLYVFSTNADPFESEKGYNKFSAFALLNHGGDFNAAADALRQRGFGARRLRIGPIDLYQRYRRLRTTLGRFKKRDGG